MARKLQKRKTRNQTPVRLNTTPPNAIGTGTAAKAAFPVEISTKTATQLSENENLQYIKSDLKRSLIIAAGIFALMAILYFFL
jgi:hypothetical protein